MKELYDMFGTEIDRGRLICYASKNIMKFGIVNKISESWWNPESIMIYMWAITSGTNKSGKKYERLMSYNIQILIEKIEDRIMVLENPEFYINNPRMGKQIRIIDLAKDKGLLPKSYEIGDLIPVLEEKV